MTNYLRPDEKAMLSEIERSRKSDEQLKGVLKTGAKTAIGLGTAGLGLAGAKMASKVMPFLNEFIPYDLALKGISKVSPELGGFLKKGMEKGLDLKEGLEFIKKNISGTEEANSPVKENRNIIQQYSPELFNFLEDQIKQGRDPLQAGAIAQNDNRFAPAIKKMSKDHKSDWSSILQTVFGQSQMAQQQQGQQQVQPQQMQQQQAQPQQAQGGQGQQALMSILQKIQQSRGQ